MWIALMRAVGGVTAVPALLVQGSQQRATAKASHGISSDKVHNLSMAEIFIEAQISRRPQQVQPLTNLVDSLFSTCPAPEKSSRMQWCPIKMRDFH